MFIYVLCHVIVAVIQEYCGPVGQGRIGSGDIVDAHAMSYVNESFFTPNDTRYDFGEFAFGPLACHEGFGQKYYPITAFKQTRLDRFS
jgi:hypothetical protein